MSDEPGYEVSSLESEPRAHTRTRADTWTASYRRGTAHDGAYRAVFRRDFHQRVDRPHAPRNLRFSTGEELAGKVTDGGGGGGSKEIRRRRVPRGE